VRLLREEEEEGLRLLLRAGLLLLLSGGRGLPFFGDPGVRLLLRLGVRLRREGLGDLLLSLLGEGVLLLTGGVTLRLLFRRGEPLGLLLRLRLLPRDLLLLGLGLSFLLVHSRDWCPNSPQL